MIYYKFICYRFLCVFDNCVKGLFFDHFHKRLVINLFGVGHFVFVLLIFYAHVFDVLVANVFLARSVAFLNSFQARLHVSLQVRRRLVEIKEQIVAKCRVQKVFANFVALFVALGRRRRHFVAADLEENSS